METAASPAPPDYGIDAPGVVRTLFFTGLVLVVLAFATRQQLGGFALPVEIVGAIMLAEAGLMIRTSRVTKRQEWETILDEMQLRGDERALDVGCGTGLVSVLAAHRLERGRVTGIDIWQKKDQTGHSPQIAKRNVTVEGVAARVTIRDGDARELPFRDASFDVVLSSLVLHNIHSRADRARSVDEMARVLRPGGRIAVLDVGRTQEYAARLRAAGLQDVIRSKRNWALFPPARLVTATKP
ncbi:MAG: class I SAM-dependent methyltransferase [Egibacteraceae bacterium]